MPTVQIMNVRVVDDAGVTLATVERVAIGGGTQTVTVDGVAEERQHPTFEGFHVRLLSPDRMIPDELRDMSTYEDAVDLAVRYGEKRLEHAAQVADLAESLRMP